MPAKRCKDPRCGAFAPRDSDWCKRHRPLSEALAVAEEAGLQGAAAVGVVQDVAVSAVDRFGPPRTPPPDFSDLTPPEPPCACGYAGTPDDPHAQGHECPTVGRWTVLRHEAQPPTAAEGSRFACAGSVSSGHSDTAAHFDEATDRLRGQAAASPAEVARLKGQILGLNQDETLPHHADQVTPRHRKAKRRTRLWHYITGR